MLAKPAMRNVESLAAENAAIARFELPGLANGSTPSMTISSPSAAARSVQWIFIGGSAARLLHVLEELAIGSDHEYVVGLADRAAIGLQAAVE
ncbi:MAG: hypothetical protein HW417_1630 [Steroidobacteraceae bacterium]|nr:hypothetical protein [Steroidobacteraceae bacterium]MBM2854702.1 hypothetical protein [Steroidobacteraceae bacterium]